MQCDIRKHIILFRSEYYSTRCFQNQFSWPINIIRTLAETSLEENESIVITRDWEDQLRYDIVIGAKSVVLDLYLPLAFRFVPLWGKVALHRIRVYLTENLEYYCSNKKVHRMEPAKKYLLLEHKAKKGRSFKWFRWWYFTERTRISIIRTHWIKRKNQ